MIRIGLQLLQHDRVKFIAMIMAVAMASFLMQNQASILSAFLGMSGSQIRDVREANVWVMEPDTECFDQVKPMKDVALPVVRGVEGVEWAVPFQKVDTNARTDDGRLRTIMLIGVDGANRIGEPRMRVGAASSIYERNGAVVDPGGWELLFPTEKVFVPGRRIRVHDQWLRILGVSDASPPFTGFPVIHVASPLAIELNRAEPRSTSFVVARAAAGHDPEAVAKRIEAQTGWRAYSRQGFEHQSFVFYESQGVPMLFYITIAIGLTVGMAFTAQTFLMFIKENAKGITMLKVLGVTHWQLATMLVTQAVLVMVLGWAFGSGFAAMVTNMSRGIAFLRGLYIPWQVTGLTGIFMLGITLTAAFFGFIRVAKLQPADVFRS
jgi:putative ABC transport system permease protein